MNQTTRRPPASCVVHFIFFFQAEDGIRDLTVTGVQTCALPISTRNRLIFFVTAWLIVLMPFLFWWSTWFGRQISDKQIGQYLNDEKRPRHIQHADRKSVV